MSNKAKIAKDRPKASKNCPWTGKIRRKKAASPPAEGVLAKDLHRQMSLAR
jgi:hypothetical protein